MVISPREEELLCTFRRLPAGAADQVQALIRRLASLPPETRIDWCDEWSDQDLQDFTSASLKDFEAKEQN